MGINGHCWFVVEHMDWDLNENENDKFFNRGSKISQSSHSMVDFLNFIFLNDMVLWIYIYIYIFITST